MTWSPNDQNSDRGIETETSAADWHRDELVRTTRIPTEELKRRDRDCDARSRAGPNDQNSDRGIETVLVVGQATFGLRGPNDQNSDRGIET